MVKLSRILTGMALVTTLAGASPPPGQPMSVDSAASVHALAEFLNLHGVIIGAAAACQPQKAATVSRCVALAAADWSRISGMAPLDDMRAVDRLTQEVYVPAYDAARKAQLSSQAPLGCQDAMKRLLAAPVLKVCFLGPQGAQGSDGMRIQ